MLRKIPLLMASLSGDECIGVILHIELCAVIYYYRSRSESCLTMKNLKIMKYLRLKLCLARPSYFYTFSSVHTVHASRYKKL